MQEMLLWENLLNFLVSTKQSRRRHIVAVNVYPPIYRQRTSLCFTSKSRDCATVDVIVYLKC